MRKRIRAEDAVGRGRAFLSKDGKQRDTVTLRYGRHTGLHIVPCTRTTVVLSRRTVSGASAKGTVTNAKNGEILTGIRERYIQREMQMSGDNVFYKTVAEVVAKADNPITDIVVKGEKIFSVCADSNWEVERIYTSYFSPIDGLIIFMKRKGVEDDRDSD